MKILPKDTIIYKTAPGREWNNIEKGRVIRSTCWGAIKIRTEKNSIDHIMPRQIINVVPHIKIIKNSKCNAKNGKAMVFKTKKI